MGTLDNRIEKLRQQLKTENIDTFLVLIEENRRYLSGFTGQDTQFDESAGALLITSDARVLLTDSRYEIQARQESPGFDIVVYQKGLTREIPGILESLGTRRLGFESRRMSHEIHARLLSELEKSGLSVELVPTLELVETLRLIKDEDEIRAIGEAVALAEAAFRNFTARLVTGLDEKTAAWELEKQMREAGAQSLSFPVIAASGPNSALPHAIPTGRKIQASEPLLFDWGARLNGYCSDMSRTFFIEKPDKAFEKIFTTVLEAQQMAIDAIKPGKRTREIDAVARDHIAQKGFKGSFGHGLGHGVGLAVHEAPSLGPVAEKEKIISENMVFTVEPGIYVPEKGGVRLENMVVVRSHGAEVFNQLAIHMDKAAI